MKNYAAHLQLLANEKPYADRLDKDGLETEAIKFHKMFSKDSNGILEFDFFNLANYLKLSIKTHPFDDNLKLVRGYLDEYTIHINETLKKDQKVLKFAVLHECCHRILEHRPIGLHPEYWNTHNKYKYIKDCPSSSINENELLFLENSPLKAVHDHNLIEFQASYLAAAILMPRRIFIEKFTDKDTNTKWSIQRTARYFQVTRPQIMRRLNQLLLEELDIPSHWVKTIGNRFYKHEIYDDFSLPRDDSHVTKQYPAFMEANRYFYNGIHTIGHEGWINGYKFANIVVTEEIWTGWLCSNCFGIPVEYADKFNFYKQFRNFKTTLKPSPHGRKIKEPKRTIREFIQDWNIGLRGKFQNRHTSISSSGRLLLLGATLITTALAFFSKDMTHLLPEAIGRYCGFALLVLGWLLILCDFYQRCRSKR